MALKLKCDFTLLATGQTLSWLGNGFQSVALPVAVVLNGGSASELGLVMASSVAAMLVGTLFGGVWADRLQPSLVMVGSDMIRLIATLGLAVMFSTDHPSLGLLCALTAISSCAGSFFAPAMTALKPMLTTPEKLQSANARLSLLQTSCAVIGPAAGGLVVAAFGAPIGFAVDAASFLASIVTVAFIRARVSRGPADRMLRDLRAGWAEIRRHDWLQAGIFAATGYHIANGIILVLIPIVAVQDLGGASATGAIYAAEGLGGVVGATIALRFKPRRMLLAGWLALLVMPIWALSYVWPAELGAILIGAVVGYAGLTFFSVAWETAIQDHVPHRLLARVASWDMLTSFIAMPIGSALAGPLANALGIKPLFAICAVVLLLASVSPLLVAGSRRLTRPLMATSAHAGLDPLHGS